MKSCLKQQEEASDTWCDSLINTTRTRHKCINGGSMTSRFRSHLNRDSWRRGINRNCVTQSLALTLIHQEEWYQFRNMVRLPYYIEFTSKLLQKLLLQIDDSCSKRWLSHMMICIGVSLCGIFMFFRLRLHRQKVNWIITIWYNCEMQHDMSN
jgi:hypothetical protein